ncbi:hypothetical protein CI238_08128, partial [Colletotrichum incanum]
LCCCHSPQSPAAQQRGRRLSVLSAQKSPSWNPKFRCGALSLPRLPAVLPPAQDRILREGSTADASALPNRAEYRHALHQWHTPTKVSHAEFPLSAVSFQAPFPSLCVVVVVVVVFSFFQAHSLITPVPGNPLCPPLIVPRSSREETVRPPAGVPVPLFSFSFFHPFQNKRLLRPSHAFLPLQFCPALPILSLFVGNVGSFPTRHMENSVA